MIKKIIYLDSQFKTIWNIIISISVVVSITITPLVIVLNIKNTFFLYIFDVIIGLLFIADIFINFRSAYKEDKLIITDPVKIRKRYMQSWFFFDVLAALPFFLIPGIYISFNRVIRFLRLIRIFKVFTLFQAVNSIKKHKVSSNLIRLLIMGFWLLLTAHLIACGFIFVGGISPDLSPAMRYIQAFYWTTTTLATVGYGDFIPNKNNAVQLIYVIFAQIIGVGMYGYVIGSVTNVISNLDISKSNFMERMEKMYAFLKYRRISDSVLHEVNDYYNHLWESRRGYEESDILSDLPRTLRLMIAKEIHSDIIAKVPFFKDASESFIQDITLSLVPLIFTPGHVIITKGDPGFEVFFINRGSVNVLGDDEKTVVATLCEGGFFGEIALLFDAPRSATIIANDYCDLYALHKDSFDKVLCKHTNFAKKIQSIAEERKKDYK